MKFGSYQKQVFKNAGKVSHLTYQLGEDSLLRRKSSKVKLIEIKSKKIQDIIKKLKLTLKEYKRLVGKGRGVAAVQIGEPLQITVVFINSEIKTIINPKVIKKSTELFIYPEICMSANPIIAKVIRPTWVEIEYLDEKGDKNIWKQQNDLITNRVLQHEIDHMKGIINIDLVKSRDLILDSDPDLFKNAKFEKIEK